MNEEKIFLGNTPTKTRAFLLSSFKALRGKYKRIVVPCCGQFAIPLMALKAGWKPEQICTSDVSLFTTILAYYIQDKALDDLDIKVEGEPWTKSKHYAEVMFWLKFYTTKHQARHYYQKLMLQDMRARQAEHIAKLAETMKVFEDLRGMSYRAIDLFDETAEALEDETAIIWINPPGYKLGYARMYDTGRMVEWKEPHYEEFIPNEHHDLLRNQAIGKPGLFLWYRYNEITPEDRDYAVFADQKGRKRWDYTLSNRPSEFEMVIAGKKKSELKFHFEVLPTDHEITAGSQVSIKPVDEVTAMYYRDLFIHRLGSTSSRANYLLLIDGFVAGALGIVGKNEYTRWANPFAEYIEEGYGITAPSKRHPKLNRLIMMLIKSEDFLRQFDTLHFRALGVSTTCLARYPELKVNRGIYKLVKREDLKKFGYRLRYQGERTTQRYKEVLAEWMKKYS